MANAFESLIPTARKIRDAAYEGENTAERVGGLFVELLTAAAEALYGQDGAATLLRELSRDGLLTPGDRLAVEHKATSATITIPTVYADGTSGTSSAVIGAVGNKAGLMLPAHVDKITSVAESLARLPVLPYNGTVGDDVSVDAGAPGRGLLTAAIAAGGLSVVFQPSSGRFLLSLSVGGETRYFAYWTEAEDGAGNVVARASSEYSSGRLFSNSADGRRLYLLREGADGQAQLCRIDDDGRIDALRARIDKLAEALEDLPVVDFIRIEDALVAVSDWPGAIQTAANQCGVVYNSRLRLFLLKVASAVSREVSYYSSWDEVRATSGDLLARPSADYQRRPEGGDAAEVLSGRLFLLRANGSDPAVLYAWDGGMLRQVNNFAGKITSILASVADLASEVDGHTNRLWRAEERLGDHEDMISAV
ncbi:MAG: hypothetical protein K2G30_06510, partial [Muribaculaceae bacterium]|nr:hypothetical protein [Muribaculaceae bacterium]